MIATPATLVSAALRHPAKRPYGQSDRNSRLLRRQRPAHPHPCSPGSRSYAGTPTHSAQTQASTETQYRFSEEVLPLFALCMILSENPILGVMHFRKKAGGRRCRPFSDMKPVGGGTGFSLEWREEETTPGISYPIKLGSRCNAYKITGWPLPFCRTFRRASYFPKNRFRFSGRCIRQPWRRL